MTEQQETKLAELINEHYGNMADSYIIHNHVREIEQESRLSLISDIQKKLKELETLHPELEPGLMRDYCEGRNSALSDISKWIETLR